MFKLNRSCNIGYILEQENYNKLYDNKKIDEEYQKYVKHPEYLLNEDYYYAYLSIVERCKNLCQELGVKTSTLATFTFEYLLKNGYLSKNKNLKYSVDNRVNNAYLYGADIMRGKSVCLNNACMLSDVLNRMGYNAYPVFGKVINDDKTKDEVIVYQDINHTITLIKDDDNYYLADVTSSDLLKFNGFMRAEYTCSSKTIKIKPEYSLRLGYMAPDEYKDIVNGCYRGVDNTTLNHHNTIEIKKRAFKLCRKNLKLLRNFYLENIDDINIVNETLVDDKVLEKKYQVN